MQIYTVPCGRMLANCYLVTQDGKNAVLIDCGGKEPLAVASEKGLTVRYVLLTHGHFDHIEGCAALQAAGAKVGCLREEEKLLHSPANLASVMGFPVPPFRWISPLRTGKNSPSAGWILPSSPRRGTRRAAPASIAATSCLRAIPSFWKAWAGRISPAEVRSS